MRLQPVAQQEQATHRRLELRDLLRPLAAPAGHAYARGHLGLVHIKPPGTLNDRLHDCLLSNDNSGSSPAEPREQTSLMGVLEGNSPVYRRDSNAMLTTGSQAP